MRVLIAFDKFKDALSAPAACATVAAALRAREPEWTFDLCPLTDGGDGFAEILCAHHEESLERIGVTGPRGGTVLAPLGLMSSWALTDHARRLLGIAGQIAILDLASTSGLALLPPERRDPWQTGTGGSGELLRAAIAEHPDGILLGIGGSATNDLGTGALASLGFRFLDTRGAPITQPVPAVWDRIVRIEPPAALNMPPLVIACDVTNPLLGPQGAAAVFGPQKGLPAGDVARLDAAMARMAGLLCSACGRPPALADIPGAGAAGGIAFGLQVALGARIVSGAELVFAWLDLPARIAAADLVLTGEGRYDATSRAGKGTGALVAAARAAGKRVMVFAGTLDGPAGPGLHAITPPQLPLAEALPRTAELLAAAVSSL